MSTRLVAMHQYGHVAVGAALAGFALYPRTTSYAESHEQPTRRKPIYDEPSPAPTQASTALAQHGPAKAEPSSSSSSSTTTTTRTPTDRLAKEIGRSRIFVQAHLAAGERKLNELLTALLHAETNIAHTVASLAPAPQTGEKLLPGAIYVLVAAMTGSIMTRNRNIVFRAGLPLALGIGAGWLVVPVTMRNVSELLWTYEKRYPRVAEGHLLVRERVERFASTAKAHSMTTVGMVEDKLAEGREAMEGWVKKGK